MLITKILISLLLNLQPHPLPEIHTLNFPEFTVKFESDLEQAAHRIADIYPGSLDHVEESLRWESTKNPTIVLLNNRDIFAQITGSELVAAVAIPEYNLIIINYHEFRNNSKDLKNTLKHELAHLILHQHIKSDLLPRWLDEGIAQWVSYNTSQLLIGRRPLMLERAILLNNLLSLEQLYHRFPESPRGMALAYEQSVSFVKYLIATYGEDNFFLFLLALRNDDSIEEAATNVFGKSIYKLESEWYDNISGSISWILFVSNNLYQILFSIASLLLIVAFIKVLIRKRSYREEEEDL